MHSLLQRAKVSAKRSKFLRFGLPFLSFMVLGSFGLSEFTEVRVRSYISAYPIASRCLIPSLMRPQVKKNDEKTHMLTAEETLQFQKKVNLCLLYLNTYTHTHTHTHTHTYMQVKSVDAEEELKKTLGELDIDHWVNKRVPRPPGWEE